MGFTRLQRYATSGHFDNGDGGSYERVPAMNDCLPWGRHAEVVADTRLPERLNQPQDVQDEIVRINTDETSRPPGGLRIPLLAGPACLVNSLRMVRLPDPLPSGPRRRTDGHRLTFASALRSYRSTVSP